MFFLAIMLMLISLLHLIFSGYCRFIKKKPLRFEHTIVKLFLVTQEVGKTRLFQNSDLVVTTMSILPFIIWYPEYQKNLAMIYFTVNTMLILHSLTILMYKQKHKKTHIVARCSLALVLFLSVMVFIV